MNKNKINNDNVLTINDLKFFYGIPRCTSTSEHYNISTEQIFYYARNNGLNFIFLSDNNNLLLKRVSMQNKIMTKFEKMKYTALSYRRKHNHFIPLIGFQTSTSFLGNISIINSNTFFTGIAANIELFLLWCSYNNKSLIIISNNENNITNFNYNKYLNKIVQCIEVSGSNKKNCSICEKNYYHMLDMGWELSAVSGGYKNILNSSNLHSTTCVLSQDFAKDSILNSFKLHRTYSTESLSLKFYFTINNHFMGGTIPKTDEKLFFSIYAEDKNIKINSIFIISQNGIIIKRVENLNLNKVKYLYSHKPRMIEHWYIIKIVQENNKTAYSSPIFR
ncbi:histidinol phosphatase [Clostridium sp. BJN0001]|uniref:histidinol phosphatase n=1 Tax=Clostridium sp. BJN0001 TaxID=2930219 RepID=UPI001FD1FD2E|nr:histidinol phosphatase [Clostridium sp. BJN0001]